MGFFGKIFKGIGKVFKGIGKFLKKGWKKFGKFMNSLGIVGQIGMMLVTSGMMNVGMAALGKLASGAMTGLKAAAVTSKAAAAVLKGVNTVANAGNAVREGVSFVAGSITNAVGSVLKPTMQAVGNGLKKIGYTPNPNSYLGKKFIAGMEGAPTSTKDFFDSIGEGLTKTYDTALESAKKTGTYAREAVTAPFTAPDIRTVGTKGAEGYKAFDVSQTRDKEAFEKAFEKAAPSSKTQSPVEVETEPTVVDKLLSSISTDENSLLSDPNRVAAINQQNPANLIASGADQMPETLWDKTKHVMVPTKENIGQAVTATVVPKLLADVKPDQVMLGSTELYLSRGMEEAAKTSYIANVGGDFANQFDSVLNLEFNNPIFGARFNFLEDTTNTSPSFVN